MHEQEAREQQLDPDSEMTGLRQTVFHATEAEVTGELQTQV